MNWWLFGLGIIFLYFAWLIWMYDHAPVGHEDEDGFHLDKLEGKNKEKK